MRKINELQADLILLIVAILWGTTFVASKIALDYCSPMVIISIRFILAFMFMALLFHKEIKNINREDLIGGIIVGIVLFIAFFTQLIALKYTDPGKQAFLAGTYVIFVPFMIWIVTKSRPDNRSFLGAFMCFVGISFLTINSSFSMSYGDGLTLLSSIFFAGHIMATGHFVKKSTPIKITIVQFATVAVLATSATVLLGDYPKTMPTGVIAAIIYLGILCTGVAYFLQTLAQNYTKTSHTAIILSLEAVFGSLLSIVIMHEVFTFKMIIGSVIILASILIIELKGAKQEDVNDENLECI